ncbi:hypothetical protein OPT61_g6776 [Boeremia exigua]|uniref:Uncharacterized protein n=1 Tax=Boeremia exigua TaxID=749465 RepID=A0ACC2I5X8_9PLEO|nr:hypothetical protein OPT61_g6776 [Boeremia exigua]
MNNRQRASSHPIQTLKPMRRTDHSHSVDSSVAFRYLDQAGTAPEDTPPKSDSNHHGSRTYARQTVKWYQRLSPKRPSVPESKGPGCVLQNFSMADSPTRRPCLKAPDLCTKGNDRNRMALEMPVSSIGTDPADAHMLRFDYETELKLHKFEVAHEATRLRAALHRHRRGLIG